jgi:TrmH family RNA methyltransferase
MPVRSDVRFVLVRPRRPQNVAAGCRALKNMGFARLCLVDPPEGLEAERGVAYGAWDVLDGIETAASLREAIADCTVVAATSGRATRDVISPRHFAQTLDQIARGGDAAIVFGPEDNGLSLDERALCHVTVRIPSAPAQPSLNLAQAVLVLAYELSLAGEGPLTPAVARASAAEFETAIDALRDALLAIGYLNPKNPDAVLGELRRLLWRGMPTSRDIVLLRGLARQIAWGGAHSGTRADGA